MKLYWRWILLAAVFALSSSAAVIKDENSVSAEKMDEPQMLPVRVESTKKRKTTSDVLRHIGMTRVKNPSNHHRKRLASQSRKSHSGDSHMYVIKLPPNPYYYDPEPTSTGHAAHHNVNRIPIDFKSNGKPGKIYHWNLPVVKNMVARKSSAKAKGPNQVYKPTFWEDEPHKRVSYYKPKKPSKQAFQKYFPGNGKPHALYIIESKKRPNLHRVKE